MMLKFNRRLHSTSRRMRLYIACVRQWLAEKKDFAVLYRTAEIAWGQNEPPPDINDHFIVKSVHALDLLKAATVGRLPEYLSRKLGCIGLLLYSIIK
jgi:hypothetical protein